MNFFKRGTTLLSFSTLKRSPPFAFLPNKLRNKIPHATVIKYTVLNVATARLGVLGVPPALVHEAANGARVPVVGASWVPGSSAAGSWEAEAV